MSTLCEEISQVQDVSELIPARMLNEFAYCPRLADSPKCPRCSLLHAEWLVENGIRTGMERSGGQLTGVLGGQLCPGPGCRGYHAIQ